MRGIDRKTVSRTEKQTTNKRERQNKSERYSWKGTDSLKGDLCEWEWERYIGDDNTFPISIYCVEFKRQYCILSFFYTIVNFLNDFSSLFVIEKLFFASPSRSLICFIFCDLICRLLATGIWGKTRWNGTTFFFQPSATYHGSSELFLIDRYSVYLDFFSVTSSLFSLFVFLFTAISCW